MEVVIEDFNVAPTDEQMARIVQLLSQLIKDPICAEDILECISEYGTYLLLAVVTDENPPLGFTQGDIVGVATLVEMLTCHGLVGYVHDVVVDETLRNSGVGTKLMEEVDKIAKQLSYRELNLTSNPATRQDAVHIYEKLGYKAKPTSMFFVKKFV